MKNILVAGTGTGVGKTMLSAILVQMLGADYWKPVSCGPDSKRDTLTIRKLIPNPNLICHPEAYHFRASESPHHAAALENIEPKSSKLILPKSSKRLVIESAGGILVPLNNKQILLDSFCKWDADWVLISRNELGSINDTLLTFEALMQRKINLIGIVFNGAENRFTERFITDYTDLPVVGRIHEEKIINSNTIKRYSDLWKKHSIWKKMQ